MTGLAGIGFLSVRGMMKLEIEELHHLRLSLEILLGSGGKEVVVVGST